MKVALILIGGIADRSQEQLGWRTPLQVATLPNLDALALAGACGHVYPLAPGICPETGEALWEILGYGERGYPGRTSIEAAGAGAVVEPGEVVFRVDLAITMVDGGKRYVQTAPAHLQEEQAGRIADSLSKYEAEHFASRLIHLGGPLMALGLSGGASRHVSDSDPVFYRLPIPEIVPLAGNGAEASRTARELSRFSEWAAGVLESHPVNAERESEAKPAINHALIKWPSIRPEVPRFSEAWGFDGVLVGEGVLHSGLAQTLGFEYREVKSSGAGEELYNRLLAAREALDAGFDFALVHSEAADIVSRGGRPRRKVRTLEELDLSLTAVREHLAPDPDLLTIITSDHTSPSGGTGEVIHSGESVPLLVVGKNARLDQVASFDEISCLAGSIGQVPGRDLMQLALDLADRARLGISRLGPHDRPYRPLV